MYFSERRFQMPATVHTQTFDIQPTARPSYNTHTRSPHFYRVTTTTTTLTSYISIIQRKFTAKTFDLLEKNALELIISFRRQFSEVTDLSARVTQLARIFIQGFALKVVIL